MKKTILLLFTLACLCASSLHAQKLHRKSAWSGIKAKNLLANDAWRVTSTQQQALETFNGEVTSHSGQVTISYKNGHFKFAAASGRRDSYTVKADYDKTELGVVYFIPKNKAYTRITVHREDKLVVVEKADHSMVSYRYADIAFSKPVDRKF